MTVREVCELLGDGPEQVGAEERIYYNDIQCGNGPANDVIDETLCPGRVDLGTGNISGCLEKGPKWDFGGVSFESLLYSLFPNLASFYYGIVTTAVL